MREVRLLDLGFVSALRSQTIYHGVAESVSAGGQDTISLLSPGDPYVCVGMHQELEKEVDLDYCRDMGLPVYRRRVGGGAVYLDRDQLFYHIMFHKDHAPRDITEVYNRFLKAPVEAYRALGIEAFHRPVNDLQVDNRKIGGTGAATMGDCVVVVGSLILDFNYEAMSRLLKVPDEKFRDKVYKSMSEYLTTVKRELGSVPPRDEVKEVLISKFKETLDVELVRGELSPEELQIIEGLDGYFVSDEWLNKVKRRHPGFRKVKISEGVHVVESTHKSPGGLIRASSSLKDDVISEVVLTGDFFIYPDVVGEIEEALAGVKADETAIADAIGNIYSSSAVQSPGVTPADFAKAIIG
ncbi:MAG: lipoate--protein ligase family protein [Candidatus Altiarchaeales archaeon]|nr:lipoate--protein ligase family protein [Candidatus Altiarchaeales archaeon]MBD3416088.1 lipoate--protein ligase family protein [Candidatus Altiarchaeales archaeon]